MSRAETGGKWQEHYKHQTSVNNSQILLLKLAVQRRKQRRVGRPARTTPYNTVNRPRRSTWQSVRASHHSREYSSAPTSCGVCVETCWCLALIRGVGTHLG